MTGILEVMYVIFIKKSIVSSVTLAFVIVKHWTKYTPLFVCTCTVVNFGMSINLMLLGDK